MLQQLGRMVSIVRQHIRNYLDEIAALIKVIILSPSFSISSGFVISMIDVVHLEETEKFQVLRRHSLTPSGLLGYYRKN